MGGANTGESSEPPASPAPVAPQTLYVNANTGDDDKGDGTETNPYKTVGKAAATAQSGATIYLAEGNYSTYTKEKQPNYGKKNLTFVGQPADNTKVNWQIGAKTPNPALLGTEYNGDYSFDSRGVSDIYTVTFRNLTLQSSSKDYLGFIGIDKTVVENCTLNGKTFYWGYTSAEFNNCTFNCPTGDYAIWTYSSPTMSFDNCTFNSSGKVINVYTDYGAGKNNITVNYNSCMVVSSAPNKAVLNINDSNMGSNKYILNITGNNVVKGLDADDVTCSRLFGFGGTEKNPWIDDKGVEHYNNAGRTDVTINGVKVWEKGERAVDHNYNGEGFTVGSSYQNGVCPENSYGRDVQYTDGYKDGVVTETNREWRNNKLYVSYKCEYCGWTETKVVEQKWNINVSKIATELKKDANGDYKTNVTLSVPGVEKNLNSDVVFVLDTSDCVGGVMQQVKTLVENLSALSSEKKVNIKVGVVAFKGSAAAMFGGNLVSVDDAVTGLNAMIAAVDKETDKEAAVLSYLSGGEDFIKKGSNLHSGLLAAQKLLDGDKYVDNDRKYLITVTDALTYYWNDDQGNVYGIYDEMHPDTKGQTELLFEIWGPAFGVNTGNPIDIWCIYDNSPVKDWDNYINDVRSRIANDNGKYDTNVREAIDKLNATDSSVRWSTITDLENNSFNYIPYYSEPDEHAHGIERSIVACIDTYKQLVNSDYNCYVVNSKPQYELSGLVTSELNKLAGQNATIDFNTIENKILYAVDKGSYVVDVIGDKFTLDVRSLKLKVGNDELKGTFDKTTNMWSFGSDTNGNARFTAAYNAVSKTITWNFNEKVSNFARVQLSYTLKLTTPETTPGHYGKLDLDGSKYNETAKYPDVLYTNEETYLHPNSSNGIPSTPVPFPMPSVEYTVRNPYRPPVNPGIGDEITVEITGSSDSVVYDGAEHSVKDYTVKISDPRYTEADFTFTGKAEASGVNAGTYEMGLKAEQFKNTNARFTNVKFVIKADGVLTITPKELTITAGSKTEYGPTPVTCGEWTVSGLAAGDKVESVKITGIQSVPGSSPNVPSDAVIKNAKGEDVTKNYAIKYVNGTLTMLEVLNKEDHFNYIIGTPEGLSLPTANVTRAEVATIFFRLMTDDARAKFDSLDNNFSDVAKGKWYNRAISTLAKAGIIKGDPAGTYRPGDPITRAEMAAIIARFGDFKEGGKTFSDISGHWAQKYIELAASNGWINGNPDGTFKPNNNITRAETVAMINRVLDRQTKDVSDLLPVSQMTNWSDNMDTAKWYYRDMQEATNNHKAERVGNSIYEKWTEKLPDIDWASYQI